MRIGFPCQLVRGGDIDADTHIRVQPWASGYSHGQGKDRRRDPRHLAAYRRAGRGRRRILFVLAPDNEVKVSTSELALLIAMVAVFVAGLIAVSRFGNHEE